MDKHIKTFFNQSSNDAPNGNYHEVIALHNLPEITWKEITNKAPVLPKGWYELSRLNIKDRIEFSRDFWLSKLPYHPLLNNFLNQFFNRLDDVGIFLVQHKWGDPFEAQMVYSLANDSGFYRGGIPASEQNISDLQKSFSKYILPVDYLSFLQIHDGFWKTTDITGVTHSVYLYENYLNFREFLAKQGPLTTSKGDAVDPKSLIPFYETFGMPYYQCFWTEWYPEQEMGNIYYSSSMDNIYDAKVLGPSAEMMAFPTFTDWLMFYLEAII
jgi:hypothetical protein